MGIAGRKIIQPHAYGRFALARRRQAAVQSLVASIARPLKILSVCCVSVAALLALPSQVQAGENAFLESRMAVSPPLGASDLCKTTKWACQSGDTSAGISTGQLDLAASINRRVNRSVREISDMAQYGRPEYWGLPTSLGGDCEDFALLKKKLLIQQGVNARSLLIATVLDRGRNSHAVLVMRTDDGDFILDNLDDRVLHWQSTGYTFLRMQDPANLAGWTAVIAGGIVDNDRAVARVRRTVTSPAG